MIRRTLSFTTVERRPRLTDNMLVQYAIMRTDLGSMSIGRTAAQAMHVANKMYWDVENWQDTFVSSENIPLADRGTGSLIMRYPNVRWSNPEIKSEYTRTSVEMTRLIDLTDDDYEEWTKEATGFGTAIVLGADERTLRRVVTTAYEAGLWANLVVDPEYFVQDGKSGHMVPNVLTGGYIFGRKIVCEPFTSGLKLLGMD